MPTNDNTATGKEVNSFTAEDYQRYLLQKVVLDELFKIHKDYGRQIEKSFEPGDKRSIKNAQGVALGSLSKSMPSKKAVCADASILAAMAEEKGMELIDTLPSDPNRLQDAVNYLFEHAPELLDIHVSKEDEKELAAAVLEQWQITGELPTGWDVVDASAPSFRVSKGRSDAAKAATEHLLGQTTELLQLDRGQGEK